MFAFSVLALAPLPQSVGGNEQVKDYLGLLDYDVNQIATALK